MTHCSTGGINYVGNKAPDDFINPDPFYRIPGKSYSFPQGNKNIGLYCDQFNDPNNFTEALEVFPKLKICFAHFGLDAANMIGPSQTNTTVPLFQWTDKVLDLMDKYDEVYTDISYSVAYNGFCEWFLIRYQALKVSIQDRIMFGTDYFMTVQEEFGNDNQIIENVKKKIFPPIFEKIAYTNVINYLKIK